MLVVFGGLPGAGKTTLARAIASRTGAAYLRIDAIEQALRASGVLAGDVGTSGYDVANALAASNLANGVVVIADCVNPVGGSRRGWQETAANAESPLIEIEVVCSDTEEHRRRIEDRRSDIAGLELPSWEDVMAREYEPWHAPHLSVDTARLTVDEAVDLIVQHMRDQGRLIGPGTSRSS